MKTKFINDAIIGNDNMAVSFSKKGELLRLFFPSTDYKQFVEFFHTGLKINDSNLVYLHDDINNLYNQYYTENTNVLNTEIYNSYFNLKIFQTDFVTISQDVLVKRYTFYNENTINLDLKFLIHSKLFSNYNNMISCLIEDNCMRQYCHDYIFNVFSKEPILSHQIHGTKENISTGMIFDKDYIGMASDSSISYDIGIIKPGEKKRLDIFIKIHDNNLEKSMSHTEEKMEELRKIDAAKEEQLAKKYWRRYVEKHDTINLENLSIGLAEKLKQIYTRSILLFPLLTNSRTGGISAALEIDEEQEECGRYSYCWTRDAIFVTEAMDLLGMEKDTEKFYKIFCKETQNRRGMWEQRYYTDGRLAPCWGYQIDETASVIHGIYSHYTKTKDLKFLRDNLKMCEKGVAFLKTYLNDVFKSERKMQVSYDLWEMDEGIHLYSMASIFSSFESMIHIYDELTETFQKNRLKLEQIEKEKQELNNQLLEIKKFCITNLYDESKKSFVRGVQNRSIDISTIGAIVPFNMFSPKEKEVQNTVEKINLTLRTYTGGYLRFENDTYLGGRNPWPITTLWMALYYIKLGEYDKAKECLSFVIKTATEHGFLGEQVDNSTMKTNWVIGLGWSHAMFIIVLYYLKQNGKL